jgi:hypothetical protein
MLPNLGRNVYFFVWLLNLCFMVIMKDAWFSWWVNIILFSEAGIYSFFFNRTVLYIFCILIGNFDEKIAFFSIFEKFRYHSRERN